MKTAQRLIIAAAATFALCSTAQAVTALSAPPPLVSPTFSSLNYDTATHTFSASVRDVHSEGNPFNRIGFYVDNTTGGSSYFGLDGIDLSASSSSLTYTEPPPTISWSTSSINPGTGAFSWWAVAFKMNGGQLVSNPQTVAATPIPGAAWLLGSGIIGLVGLSRSRKNTPNTAV